jgi:hypothetical protein
LFYFWAAFAGLLEKNAEPLQREYHYIGGRDRSHSNEQGQAYFLDDDHHAPFESKAVTAVKPQCARNKNCWQ